MEAHTLKPLYLSAREVEVLALVCEGLSAKAIADRLEISQKTVEYHRGNLLLKLNVTNTALLVRTAIRLGFVEP